MQKFPTLIHLNLGKPTLTFLGVVFYFFIKLFANIVDPDQEQSGLLLHYFPQHVKIILTYGKYIAVIFVDFLAHLSLLRVSFWDTAMSVVRRTCGRP